MKTFLRRRRFFPEENPVRAAGLKRSGAFRGFAGRVGLIALAVFCFSGCEQGVSALNDLAVAQEAAARQDWPQVARLLPRYLQEEDHEENRWIAWSLLVTASESMGETAWAVDYLEAMLQEYAGDRSRVGAVLRRLGDNYAKARLWDKASATWLRLLDVEEMSPDETAILYRKIGFFHFWNRAMPAAADMFEMCEDNASSPDLRAECRFWLADILANNSQLDVSLEKIDELLAQESVPPGMAGQAYFLQGDILQQQNKPEEALAAFEKALPLHANPSVIQSRIDYLRETSRRAARP
jgi:tetratricopeptide (TPR) repeat protein